MKRIVIIALLCIAWILQLQAQETEKFKDPDEQIIVNKRFDENGNLIQYDSTYVHQWSSDSTFNFPFGEDFTFGGNIEDFLDGFMNSDSIMSNFGFPNNFFISPFDSKDYFDPFNNTFPDSLFLKHFQMNRDSLLNYNFRHPFPNDFNLPDFDEIRKQMQEQLELHGYQFPDFQSKEQQEEWEKLMNKQQKEKEEFLKKWGEKNK